MLWLLVLLPVGTGWLTEPGAKVFVILTERWRWQLMTRRCERERDWMTNHGYRVIPVSNLDNGIEAEFAG
jgi:hypothetical protein